MKSEFTTPQARFVAKTDRKPSNVLISGASFAGLAAAFWMNRLGYTVTVVEIGKGLKTGGSPVDIKESPVNIVKRMGLLERIQASSLKAKAVDFLDSEGVRIAKMPAQAGDAQTSNPEYEIERDTLLHMLFEEVKGAISISNIFAMRGHRNSQRK